MASEIVCPECNGFEMFCERCKGKGTVKVYNCPFCQDTQYNYVGDDLTMPCRNCRTNEYNIAMIIYNLRD